MPIDIELTGAGFPGGQANALQGSITLAVAAAGSNQAGATTIIACNSQVSTGSGGVALPSWASTGDDFYISNNLGTTLSVYPPVGSSAKINGGSANAAISVSANKGVHLKLLDNSSNWFAVYS